MLICVLKYDIIVKYLYLTTIRSKNVHNKLNDFEVIEDLNWDLSIFKQG